MKKTIHPIFDIDGLEWLEKTLHAKAIPIEPVVVNSHKVNATWEDRCACVGMMNEPANALCSMLVWGYDEKQYQKVINHLSTILYKKMQKDKVKLPKPCTHSPAELCNKIANMVFYLHFWDLWECFTVKGKLQCGEMFGWGAIQIHERTYSNQMLKHQRFIIEKLQELVNEIEQHIITYRKNLRKENIKSFQHEPTNLP